MADKLILSRVERRVYDILKFHKGVENPIKSKEIEDHLAMDGSNVRRVVNQLRAVGVPVCSGCKGYYIAANENELNKTIAHLQSRKAGIDVALQGLLSINI